MRLVEIPFIPAAHFTQANRSRVDLIVLHSMESQEKPGTARNVAQWFASMNAPQASAHYCVDAGEVIRCVPDEDVAWHAPGANANGVGIEHAGRAAQTPLEWMDGYSSEVLALSTRLCALLCCKWAIPPVVVDEAGLLRKERGITTHAAVSRAFKRSTHTDPGSGFPLAWYVQQVERRRSELAS